MDIKFLIGLLPAVFIFHDFEEIIMFKPWLKHNRKEIEQRFPAINKFLLKRRYHLSTSAFAVAVLHEFLIVAFISYYSLYFDNYILWFALLMVVSLHFIIHVIQWIAFKKYVPCIITTVLCLPYCFYAFIKFKNSTYWIYSFPQILLWLIAGIILMILSLFSAFYFASKFDDRLNKKYHRE